jgi:glutathione peroxidase
MKPRLSPGNLPGFFNGTVAPADRGPYHFLQWVNASFTKETVMNQRIGILAGLLVLGLGTALLQADEKGTKKVSPVLNFTMKSLDGKSVDLSKYQGKVVLMVNVASKCGFTPQYKQLQALHDKYATKGLAILGFPANDFGKQEPGTNEEIASFCEKNYSVKFDMFAKVAVKGADQCPLYKYLTSSETDPKFAGPIKWNFEKFLTRKVSSDTLKG